MILLDVNASVQNAYAVNLAATENRSFTMVQWDENGQLVYRHPFTPRMQTLLVPCDCCGNMVPRSHRCGYNDSI